MASFVSLFAPKTNDPFVTPGSVVLASGNSMPDLPPRKEGGEEHDAFGAARAGRGIRKAVAKGNPELDSSLIQQTHRADHNARTRKHYEDLGYTVERVDYYDQRTQRNHDLLGFADMLCLKPGVPPLLVQLTSAHNLQARATKIRESSLAAAWLGAGGRIEVIGWKQETSAGGAISYDAEVWHL